MSNKTKAYLMIAPMGLLLITGFIAMGFHSPGVLLTVIGLVIFFVLLILFKEGLDRL